MYFIANAVDRVPLGLPEIKAIVTPICQRYGVASMFLFGSYARGRATEHSDIDFFLDPGAIKDLFTLSGFRIELVEALGREVDIVTTLPESERFQAA